MTFIQNPVEVCNQVFTLIENLTSQIRKRLEDPKSAGEQQNWKGSGRNNLVLHLQSSQTPLGLMFVCSKEIVKCNSVCAIDMEGSTFNYC